MRFLVTAYRVDRPVESWKMCLGVGAEMLAAMLGVEVSDLANQRYKLSYNEATLFSGVRTLPVNLDYWLTPISD